MNLPVQLLKVMIVKTKKALIKVSAAKRVVTILDKITLRKSFDQILLWAFALTLPVRKEVNMVITEESPMEPSLLNYM